MPTGRTGQSGLFLIKRRTGSSDLVGRSSTRDIRAAAASCLAIGIPVWSFPCPVRNRVVRKPTSLFLTALLTVSFCGGCFPTVYLPRFGMEHIDVKLTPADPVFVGPGGGGPIWAPPEVVMPGCGHNNCCDPCNSCVGNPSTPLQPIDPFGWWRAGDQGTQVMDPIGWIIGI